MNQQTVDPVEAKRRLQSLAQKAGDQGIDSLVILDPNNVYYASGFRTTLHSRFTAVALRVDAPENAVLVVPSVDKRLALEPIWYPSLLERTEIYYEGAAEDGPLINAPEKILGTVIKNGDMIGLDLATASYGEVNMVLKAFPDSEIRDASELLHDVRRVKTASELDALTRANEIAVAALKRVPELLHTGMTEIELASSLDEFARAEGADAFAYPTLIGFGPKSLAPHAPPTGLQLQAGSIVTIAFGPMIYGYCADIVRTFYYGTPPESVEAHAANCVQIQAAALAQVKPGAWAGSLMEAAHRKIHELYPDAPLAGRAGHSLGLTIHETPSLTPDNDLPLEVDMVLAVEPGAAPFQMEGVGLYRHCDVVRVTEDGYELLTHMDRGLLIVDIREG